ncbi:hypothetical protein K2173_008741 [Erythroxylum novogranatense]|uniref:Fe2OG dioxygenase domain-containing protein n=1 Tax=Erythroxylum novogranatense TaxID=1862640 RepID=A0AAV8SL49_9ROSI|nr:hypothetical protein K2173_008741 [Erythroxylum novogranatense]
MPDSKTSIDLPVIDVSQPLLLSPSALSTLSSACRDWGFFRITNHGVCRDLYRKIYAVSNDLFKLPFTMKIKAGPFSSARTYTPRFIASPFFESLRVSGPDFAASAQVSAEVLFDHPNPLFNQSLTEYCNKMSELSERIVKVVLLSLGEEFPNKFFDPDFSDCHGYLRIINYSAPENLAGEETEGLGMHTDMSCVTIVYQDDIGGLQVRSKEGLWMDINPCPDSLVVNIGDLMHAWSNARLRSSEHRVVLRRDVNRFSLAFFWCFQDEKVISAPDKVVEEGKVAVFKPFVCKDYLKFRESDEEGKFDKVGFTVRDFAGN